MTLIERELLTDLQFGVLYIGQCTVPSALIEDEA